MIVQDTVILCVEVKILLFHIQNDLYLDQRTNNNKKPVSEEDVREFVMSNELLGWKMFLGKTKTQIHKIDKFDHDQS